MSKAFSQQFFFFLQYLQTKSEVSVTLNLRNFAQGK